MNISLTNELEKFIHGKVSSGLYQNASEVVRAAVRVMMEEENDKQHRLQALRERLDRAWEDETRLTPEEVKARLKKRWDE